MYDVCKITLTWNPVTGCLHDCTYCYARRLVETRLRDTRKYRDVGFKPKLHRYELRRRFKPGSYVFVSDMGDLFGDWVPRDWIALVLNTIRKNKGSRFLLLTKNPSRYHEFLDSMPDNVVLGATIETNRDELAKSLSKAPPPSERYRAMAGLEWREKLVVVEPILDFDQETLTRWIARIEPRGVYIGYDNWSNKLQEPPLEKTLNLIKSLEELGLKVCKGTIRKAWYRP